MCPESTASTNPTSGSPHLRVALVGAGKMGQHHARAIARLAPVARLSAIADPDPAAREALLGLVPEAVAFNSLDDLLRKHVVDVVHVCTAPQTHEALAARVIETGCHVYVEKPFAESTAAAERLIALARAKGVKVCAGHQLLYEPPTRRALELLPALGTLVHMESYFSFRTVRRSPGGEAPLRADLQLLDILPHPIYMLLRAFEEAGSAEQTELTAVEMGPAGTVHALVRRGGLTGTLIVTLEGRPVESYLRVVGSNGSVYADFVRGTVQQLIGPGSSGIDKALNPFRLAGQLTSGTSAALAGRLLRRRRSYPGLVELFDAFYAAIRMNVPSPISTASILEAVRLWEQIADSIRAMAVPRTWIDTPSDAPRALVTGGTGFLGRAVVKSLAQHGVPVRVLARRLPAAWDRIPGVDYIVADLRRPVPAETVHDVDIVIHCAAETIGGWEEHRRNSIDAAEHVVRAAGAAGVRHFIHVSSLAVLAGAGRTALGEHSPLEPDARGRGPYVWGKVESERLVARVGRELGLQVKIVRPGAIVDYRSFEPPGRLGKRLGNLFVAIGSSRERLGVIDLEFAGATVAWMALRFKEAPEILNLLAPRLPTRGDLVSRLRQSNPGLRVIWLPHGVLRPLSWFAVGLQKLLRPRKPTVNVAKVFARQDYDTSHIAALAPTIDALRSAAEGSDLQQV